jgi:NAD(P)H-dependent FMN reductase/ketosteroid isomerase-like protein
MPQPRKVALIVGSLRARSYSRQIANALINVAPATLSCRIVEIGELTLYNQDLDDAPPAAWTTFRTAVKDSDAVLFVTPEYNRSIPGVLKNALDIASRPGGQSVLKGLPAGVVSVTPFKLGAFGANHALRQTFVFLNMPVMQQPEAYISDVGSLLDEAGRPKDGKTSEFLAQFMSAFADWIETAGKRDGRDREPFAALMDRRPDIAAAYVDGEFTPLEGILTRRDPATFFSPRGDATQGAQTVAKRYKEDARSFAPKGESRLEVLQTRASGDLAFWTGYQHARVHMAAKPGEAVPMTIRVTEIFRYEDGGWKLVHRHGDPQSKA